MPPETSLKFHTFQLMLKSIGLHCVNLIERAGDVYYIGLSKWDDKKTKDNGYSIVFPHSENDFTRYKFMMDKAHKIKHVL